MNKQEFKTKYNKEIIDGVKEKCQERGLIFRELSEMEVVMRGADPNNCKMLAIENELFLLYNDGDRVDYKFIGNI